MPYPQLPGRVGNISIRAAALPIAGATVVLCVLRPALLLILGGGGERLGRYAGANARSLTCRVRRLRRLQPPGTDAAFHVMSVKDATLGGDRADQPSTAPLTAGMVPDLMRNHLWKERRQAEAAVTACENAKDAIDRALADLDVAIPKTLRSNEHEDTQPSCWSSDPRTARLGCT